MYALTDDFVRSHFFFVALGNDLEALCSARQVVFPKSCVMDASLRCVLYIHTLVRTLTYAILI